MFIYLDPAWCARNCFIRSLCHHIGFQQYTCSCFDGFVGDGRTLATGGTGCDVDECTAGTHRCAKEGSTCTNTIGIWSYNCACNIGYSGNGYFCAGKLIGSRQTFVNNFWPVFDLFINF